MGLRNLQRIPVGNVIGGIYVKVYQSIVDIPHRAIGSPVVRLEYDNRLMARSLQNRINHLNKSSVAVVIAVT